jgi:hypothetical protein
MAGQAVHQVQDALAMQDVIATPFSLSQACVPALEVGLNALSGVLEAGARLAAEKDMAAAILLGWRLAPDMLPLIRQVQIAADLAKNGTARLADIKPPYFEDNETSLDQLKARLARVVTFIQSVDRSRIDSAGEREITFPLGPDNKGTMRGDDYLKHFLLPNFYFHCTVAYAILRQCGADIGKSDYIGDIPITIT